MSGSLVVRLWRVVRGTWSYYVLGRRPALLQLNDMDKEFSAALCQWDAELKGRAPVPAPPTPTDCTDRYVWKKTSRLGPTWQLLDQQTERYLITIMKRSRHVYAVYGGGHHEYRTRPAAMKEAERIAGIDSDSDSRRQARWAARRRPEQP